MTYTPETTKNGIAPETGIDDSVIATFEEQLGGRLIRPQDADYDKARALWNGMIDNRPALIAQVAGVADVMAAVKFAREHDLRVSVRGGGHNVAGNAVADGGFVIDMRPMRGIHVDPFEQTATAQGGVVWGDLDREAQAFGLATPGGVFAETGIAGLTLGGGLGWLRRKHGLSVDNLVSVDMVTADGEFVRASETENSDLFWGIRGGGGNFGIVTSFKYKLHKVGPEGYFLSVFHPGDIARAGLQFYREWAATAPDEISSFAILATVPATEDFPAAWHGKTSLVFLAYYDGPTDEGERLLQPLREFADPVADFSDVMPYTAVQNFFEEDYPDGMRYYWKSRYMAALPDDAIDLLITLMNENPSPHTTLDLWQLGGAMARIGADETAFGDRSAAFLLGIESNWEEAADDDANIAWNRKVFELVKPYATDAEYLNFPGFYENSEEQVKNAFGHNFARLVELKRKYDPTNFFRLNQNIKP